MSRRKREREEGVTELNLAPIMNMVVILIPLLLLSIVFLKVGVINTSMPELSTARASDELPDEPLNLTVAVSADGFRLAATGAVIPALAGCPDPGPTICLGQKVDLTKKFTTARQSTGGTVTALDDAMAAYDWRGLYNQLVQVKNQNKGETTVNITADPDVPYAVIVRVMDVARFRLDQDIFTKNSEFWSARYAGGAQHAELFPDPVLSVVR